MKTYSPFFQTLHDEQGPTGHLGRGTHYSVLRAVVFHDASGRPLPIGQFADFAVIWDEDHDDRVIDPIEKLYRRGLLAKFLIFGERKGCFTGIIENNSPDQSEYYKSKNLAEVAALQAELNQITHHLSSGDTWTARVLSIEDPSEIIDARENKVKLYLQNLDMLWELGVKAPSIDEIPFDPALLSKVSELELSLRSATCLKNDGIVYIAELVQRSEAEMLRGANFGRKSLDEIKEVLAYRGLRFGMEIPGWPPKNLEGLAELVEEAKSAAA